MDAGFVGSVTLCGVASEIKVTLYVTFLTEFNYDKQSLNKNILVAFRIATRINQRNQVETQKLFVASRHRSELCCSNKKAPKEKGLCNT